MSTTIFEAVPNHINWDFRLFLDEQSLHEIDLQNRKLLDKYMQFEINYIIFDLFVTVFSTVSLSH